MAAVALMHTKAEPLTLEGVTPMSIGDDLATLVSTEIAGAESLSVHVECNKIRRMLDSIDPPKRTKAVEPSMTLEPMTQDESHRFGRMPITYGRWSGTPMHSVPRDYLDWLCELKREEWKQLLRYLKTRPD